MKNTLEIIGGILVFLFVIALCVIAVCFSYNKIKENNKKDNRETEEKYEDYKRLKNDNIKYKYIESYDEYLDLIEDEDFSKNDYYKTFSKKDFKNSKYLFVIIPFDPCSETFINDEIVKDDDIYKIYLDMKYKCGGCAPAKKVLAYEVDESDLKVKFYNKTIKKEQCDPYVSYKPMIYIYPTNDIDLTITLGKKENLLYTYPKYNQNWQVHVTTDGNIYDYNTMRNYYGLYWEGVDNYKLDMSTGFVVKGKDTVKFLEEKLAILGLNDYEIDEFIVYWIDKLEKNNYNFISFRDIKDIEESMPLYISEKPDTLIRVMMDYKPLDNYVEVDEQQLVKAERNGYTVVEWGGTSH